MHMQHVTAVKSTAPPVDCSLACAYSHCGSVLFASEVNGQMTFERLACYTGIPHAAHMHIVRSDKHKMASIYALHMVNLDVQEVTMMATLAVLTGPLPRTEMAVSIGHVTFASQLEPALPPGAPGQNSTIVPW